VVVVLNVFEHTSFQASLFAALAIVEFQTLRRKPQVSMNTQTYTSQKISSQLLKK
jgi:hypothetical protein